MKIAIVGYGRMGHAVEQVALQRGHQIVARIDKDNISELESLSNKEADVAIEFTTPATADTNVKSLLQKGIRVVSGTTGWDVEMLKKEQWDAGWVWSSNYSIGVNLFFSFNQWVADRMRQWSQYRPSIRETHHVHKLDCPSGTAKTLALILKQEGYEDVEIESVREGEVNGIHTVNWDSGEDSIILEHTAKSRRGFALGAVMAAEWIQYKTGFHTMSEIL